MATKKAPSPGEALLSRKEKLKSQQCQSNPSNESHCADRYTAGEGKRHYRRQQTWGWKELREMLDGHRVPFIHR